MRGDVDRERYVGRGTLKLVQSGYSIYGPPRRASSCPCTAQAAGRGVRACVACMHMYPFHLKPDLVIRSFSMRLDLRTGCHCWRRGNAHLWKESNANGARERDCDGCFDHIRNTAWPVEDGRGMLIVLDFAKHPTPLMQTRSVHVRSPLSDIVQFAVKSQNWTAL